jgi:hypothetical protein
MRGSRIRLIERLEVDHLLVSGHRLGEPALLHQDIAQQRIVENEFALRHQRARNRLGLMETMELMQRVTA